MADSKMKPEAIFLCGIPASGKTTYANRPEFDDYIKLSSDEYINHKAKLHKLSYEEAFHKYRGNIKRYVKNTITSCVNTDQSFILDQTNTHQKPRIRKLNLVPDTFHKKAIIFNISFREALLRADIRYRTTGKYLSYNVIKDFYDNFILPTEEEGFDEIVHIGVE